MTVVGIKITTYTGSKGSTGVLPPSSNWILKDGVWEDSGVWDDTDVWNDGV